ncbi:hypothetical protein QUF72_15130 [Desulfobacterales bacterium HSG2]|nr:hypothetical protein [Desulfobacterales bacterium HSG2]
MIKILPIFIISARNDRVGASENGVPPKGALPDRFYLWKDAGNMPEPIAPTFETDAGPILKPYLDESGISPEDISSQSFELIVAAWLSSVLHIGIPPDQKNDIRNWITRSDLSEAVSGGYMRHEVTL